MSRAPVVSNVGKPHVDEQTEVCRTATARIRSNQLVRTQLISLDQFAESREEKPRTAVAAGRGGGSMNEECRSGQEAVTSRGHRLVASSRQLLSSFFFLPTVGPIFSPLTPAVGELLSCLQWACSCGGGCHGVGGERCGDWRRIVAP